MIFCQKSKKSVKSPYLETFHNNDHNDDIDDDNDDDQNDDHDETKRFLQPHQGHI